MLVCLFRRAGSSVSSHTRWASALPRTSTPNPFLIWFESSPFGILESGGSQHSIWNPLSQESQKSMLSCNITDQRLTETESNGGHQHPQVTRLTLRRNEGASFLCGAITNVQPLQRSVGGSAPHRPPHWCWEVRSEERTHCIFALDATRAARLALDALPPQGLHICG